MRRFRRSLTAIALAMAMGTTALGGATSAATAVPNAPGENVVIQWNALALQAVSDGLLGPPQIARGMAIVQTCVYDAWSAYTEKAVGTRLGGTLRRPANERTLANKSKAISYAAFNASKDLFAYDTAKFRALMTSLGYDPDDMSTDTTTPQGIGNVACQAVLDFRHHDGSNQLGDENPAVCGTPYCDYTGYHAVNDPMDTTQPFDISTVHNVNRWQPLQYVDINGNFITQPFVGAQWNKVVPFALLSADQFQGPPPARYGSKQFIQQARDLIDVSANLTDEQKLNAEYWADGPHTVLPPGHWEIMAEFISRRDGFNKNTQQGVDHDAKMFFGVANAIHDAAIVSWDNKRVGDSVRPITAIRYLFYGKKIRAWGGPYQGTIEMDGAEWFPYQATNFPTPPFPSYSSGHSTFSAAGAQILRTVTGSDYLGFSINYPAGSGKTEPGLVPARDTTLYFATLKDAADAAGNSRRWGGIHFWQDDFDARTDGTLLAQQAWNKALRCFMGDVSGCMTG